MPSHISNFKILAELDTPPSPYTVIVALDVTTMAPGGKNEAKQFKISLQREKRPGAHRWIIDPEMSVENAAFMGEGLDKDARFTKLLGGIDSLVEQGLMSKYLADQAAGALRFH